MPGVVITTAVRTGPAVTLLNQSSQAFFVGIADRGPTDRAVLVRSLEEFEDIFGGYISSALLHPTVEMFFEEGGTQCYIARVVGNAATTGTLSLADADTGTTAGANSVAMILTANGPGAWSTSVKIAVTAGTVAGTVSLQILFDDVQVGTTGNCITNAQIIGKINSHAVMSKYVTATAGVSVSQIATISATALSAGDSHAAGITDARLASAFDLFTDALGSGAVACPESSAQTVYTKMLSHANTYNRIALLHGVSDDTIAEAKTFAQTVIANESNLEHGALYYPWVYAPSNVSGVNRLLPPDGFVAAKRSRNVNTIGTHSPFAGATSTARFVIGVVTDIDRTNGDALDAECVNGIRVIQNSVRVYGARSLSQDTTNFRYITSQDTVNSIVTEAYNAIEPLVFSAIDGRGGLFANIEARLISVLEGYRINGALFEAFDQNGQRVDYGYTVRCDAKLNPTASLADGKVKAKVGIRVSSIGDRIEVEIIKSALTASVTS